MAAEQSESSSSTVPELPNPARIITTTNPETGISTFDNTFEESLSVVQNLGGTIFRLAYVSGRAPEPLNGSDLNAYSGHLGNLPLLVAPGGGATVWYVDTPPGGESPMHRTISLDFIFVIEGDLQLTLDSGETRTLRPGDTAVQRGTSHKWTNLNKDKWVRMIAVMSESQPIELNNGTTLGTVGLS